jgi:hypothetical protein
MKELVRVNGRQVNVCLVLVLLIVLGAVVLALILR